MGLGWTTCGSSIGRVRNSVSELAQLLLRGPSRHGAAHSFLVPPDMAPTQAELLIPDLSYLEMSVREVAPDDAV